MGLIKQLLSGDRKFSPASDVDWPRIQTLVHGPGASGDPAGEGDANSAVFACLMAIALAYPEPPIRAMRKRGGREYPIPDSALQSLLDRPTPNAELSIAEMWFWTAWAKHTDGKGYWLMVRSGDAETGNVVELWPVSPVLIKPITERDRRGRAKEWISYYRLQTGPNSWERVPVGNVIHFRLGVDDQDMRLGLSPLKRLVRQVASDEEASKFTAALLKNYAVPGLVVIPSGDAVVDQPAANRIKQVFIENFSNDSRGNVAVMGMDTDIKQFGFSPEQMDMNVLHKIPEQRIAAVIGVPAVIAGLGAGLDAATYSNTRELKEMFTETRLVPLWGMDAARLNASLKPNFSSDRNVSLQFDLSDVRALQEDEDKKYARLNLGVQGARPWILRNEARADIGLDPIPGWDDEDMAPPPPPPQFPPPADDTAENEEGEKGRPFPGTALPFGANGSTLRPTSTKTTARLSSPNARSQLVNRRRRIRERTARRAERAIEKWFAELADSVSAGVMASGKAQQELGGGDFASLVGRYGLAGAESRMAVKQLTERELEKLLARLFGQAAPVLEGYLKAAALEVMAGSWEVLNIELGQVLQFDENDPLVSEVLKAAGERIKDIKAATLDALRAELPGLYAEGLPTDEIADRVRGLIAETYAGRGKAIARTEVGLAQNSATSGRYKSAGVEHVEVFDNGFDNSHEFCRRVAGKVVTVGWAERNPLQHPNCVRAFGAVFDYTGPVFTEEQRWV